MRLQLRTWPEVETYLKTSRGIIMPIGSTEQHGPNGLIGTDAICAEQIAWGVGEVPIFRCENSMRLDSHPSARGGVISQVPAEPLPE